MNKFLEITNNFSLGFLALLSIFQYASGEFYFLMNLILISITLIILMINKYNPITNDDIAESVRIYNEETEVLRNKADNVNRLIYSINKICANKLGFTNEIIDEQLQKDFGISLIDIYEEEKPLIEETAFPEKKD